MNNKTAPTHRVIKPRILYFGTPVVLVSTENPDGSTNVAPMSSAWWVSESCMLGLDEMSQTTQNLRRTGELVLNLADSTMVDAVDRLALLTGSATVPAHKSTSESNQRSSVVDNSFARHCGPPADEGDLMPDLPSRP